MSVDPRLAQAALGALSQDPAFQAHFGNAPETDSPAPTAETPAAADPPAPETPGSPPRLFAGKYETPEALEQGTLEALTHITRLQAENADLRSRVSAPAPPPETTPDENYLSALEQYGVPSDVAERAMQQVAVQTIQKFFAPMAQVAEAENTLLRSDPQYAAERGSIEQFIEQNQPVALVVNALANSGRILEAKQYARDMYRVTNMAKIEGPKIAAAAASAAARNATKVDAGISPAQPATGRLPKDDTADRSKENFRRAQGGDRDALGKYVMDIIDPQGRFGRNN